MINEQLLLNLVNEYINNTNLNNLYIILFFLIIFLIIIGKIIYTYFNKLFFNKYKNKISNIFIKKFKVNKLSLLFTGIIMTIISFFTIINLQNIANFFGITHIKSVNEIINDYFKKNNQVNNFGIAYKNIIYLNNKNDKEVIKKYLEQYQIKYDDGIKNLPAPIKISKELDRLLLQEKVKLYFSENRNYGKINKYFGFNANELKYYNIDIKKLLNNLKKIEEGKIKNNKELEKKLLFDILKLNILFQEGKINMFILSDIPKNNDYLETYYTPYLSDIVFAKQFVSNFSNLKILDNGKTTINTILTILVNIIFIGLLIYFLFASGIGGMFNLDGGYNLNKTDPKEINNDMDVKYGGNKHLKEILSEIKKLYKNGILNKYFDGMLLYGPPGTGKTLFGKVVSKELELPFYYISSNNLKSSYYGGTSRKINGLFKKIQKDIEKDGYDSAVIFIDELDSIGMNRNYSHEATQEGLNTLLTLIDGFKKSNFIIMGATNRYEVLDEALLSRLNNKIYVGIPNKEERKEIIRNQLIHNIQNFF